MFQQKTKAREQFKLLTALAFGVVAVIISSAQLQGQSTVPTKMGSGQPMGVGTAAGPPGAATVTPMDVPRGKIEEFPPVPRATTPSAPPSVEELTASPSYRSEDLQKIREEVKRLAIERDKKRADYQEAESRYRDAQKRLAEVLDRKLQEIQLLQREVDASRAELQSLPPAEGHTTSYPYTTPSSAGSGVVPTGGTAAGGSPSDWQSKPLPK